MQFRTADQAFAGYDGYIELWIGDTKSNPKNDMIRLPRTHFDRAANYTMALKFRLDTLEQLSLVGEDHFLPDHWTLGSVTALNVPTGKIYQFEVNQDVPNKDGDFHHLVIKPNSTVSTHPLIGPSKVYIWTYRGTREAWGHASMELSDGTYISWWPAGIDRKWIPYIGGTWSAPHINPQTYQDDVASERQAPDTVLNVGSLNETAIKAWWTPYNANAANLWRALDANCSTTVYKALAEGGASRCSQRPSCENMPTMRRGRRKMCCG